MDNRELESIHVLTDIMEKNTDNYIPVKYIHEHAKQFHGNTNDTTIQMIHKQVLKVFLNR